MVYVNVLYLLEDRSKIGIVSINQTHYRIEK